MVHFSDLNSAKFCVTVVHDPFFLRCHPSVDARIGILTTAKWKWDDSNKNQSPIGQDSGDRTCKFCNNVLSIFYYTHEKLISGLLVHLHKPHLSGLQGETRLQARRSELPTSISCWQNLLFIEWFNGWLLHSENILIGRGD
jgi:hypothetical protein